MGYGHIGMPKTPITKQHALDYLERMYPQALSYLDCNISDLCCEKLKKHLWSARRGICECNVALLERWQKKVRFEQEIGLHMVPISFFKRKIINADHYLFGRTKIYGTTLNFSNFLFQLYIIKATNEMAVCTVALDCVQKNGNLGLTVLNGWRRHTRSNMNIWYPAGHRFSKSVAFPIKIVYY